MNINKVNSTGYAPTITDQFINLFYVHIEYPKTGKCEKVELSKILHVFTKTEILKGFYGELPNNVYYRLDTKAGQGVNNWKYALSEVLSIS